jgi:hypothetical protein
MSDYIKDLKNIIAEAEERIAEAEAEIAKYNRIAQLLKKLFIKNRNDITPDILYNPDTFGREMTDYNWNNPSYLIPVSDEVIWKFILHFEKTGDLWGIETTFVGRQIVIILSYWAIVDCVDEIVQFLLQQKEMNIGYNFFLELDVALQEVYNGPSYALNKSIPSVIGYKRDHMELGPGMKEKYAGYVEQIRNLSK